MRHTFSVNLNFEFKPLYPVQDQILCHLFPRPPSGTVCFLLRGQDQKFWDLLFLFVFVMF